MSEKDVQITIPNSKLNIHGVLRGEYKAPLVILAPGLGGWMHDLLLFNASRYLEKENISTLRVSFYGDEKDQRDIGNFDIKTNALDIDTIVSYVKKKGVKWVGIVGHSYSGMAIVYSQKQAFDAAVLWDPSHTDGYFSPQSIESLKKDFIYIKEIDAYISAKGPGYVLSRKVFENNQPGSTKMANKFKINTLVINQSSYKAMQEFGKDYTDSIDAETRQLIIPNSSHPFTEDGAMEKLFKRTAEWLNQQYSASKI